jgi:hypothetical protein
MRIHNRADFNAGVLFLAIAAFFAIYNLEYPIGTATRMGPGYFPLLLCGIMTLLGVITLAMSLSPKDAEDPPGPTDWRGMGLVLASVFLFAMLLPVAGFLISVMTLVILASTASREFNLKTSLILGVVLVLLGYGVFGYGLELRFSILPPALTQ